jgi:hypothetical protein
MRKACAEMVPKNLKDYQNACRKDVSTEMLERLETEPSGHNKDEVGFSNTT